MEYDQNSGYIVKWRYLIYFARNMSGVKPKYLLKNPAHIGSTI